MILGLFGRRSRNAAIVERLYEVVAEASRRPAFYRDLGAPDTVEGRFEMLTLHAHLVVRRLRSLPDPASDLAQDLVDSIFAHFDAALRELGVGDISVPKRMKTMASAFLGRARAYEEALSTGGGLTAALARNVFGNSPRPAQAPELLANYVVAVISRLEGLGLDEFVAGRVQFPEPVLPESAGPQDPAHGMERHA
jgi:cytochrome b pre-mRNA-processing protein 3